MIEMARRSKTLAGGTVAAAAEVVLHTTQDDLRRGPPPQALRGPRRRADHPPRRVLRDRRRHPRSSPGRRRLPLAHRPSAPHLFGADDEILVLRPGPPPLHRPPDRGPDAPSTGAAPTPTAATSPAGALQIDHDALEHQDGGPTDIDNGQPLHGGATTRWKTNDPRPTTGLSPTRWDRHQPTPQCPPKRLLDQAADCDLGGEDDARAVDLGAVHGLVGAVEDGVGALAGLGQGDAEAHGDVDGRCRRRRAGGRPHGGGARRPGGRPPRRPAPRR